MKSFSLFIVLIYLSLIHIYASHLKSGMISIQYVSNLTYDANVILYHKISSGISIDSVTLNWGDGNKNTIPLDSTIIVGNDVEKLIYKSSHIYNQEGVYSVSISEANRISSIINIPNSEMFPFYIETSLKTKSNDTSSSVAFFADPIFETTTQTTFTQNVGVYDMDRGLLLFELVNTKEKNGNDIPGYQMPDSCFIDSTNGEISWKTPETPGIYVLTVKVSKYRNDSLISTTLMDLSILVYGLNQTSKLLGLSDWPIDEKDRFYYEYNKDISDSLNLFATFIDTTADTIEIDLLSEFDIPSSGVLFSTNNSLYDSSQFEIRLKNLTLEPRCNPYLLVIRSTSKRSNINLSKDITLMLKVKDSSISNCPTLNFDTLSSISEVGTPLLFHIFPVPTENKVFFQSNLPTKGTLHLFNLSGELLLTQNLDSSDSNHINLDIYPGNLFFYMIEYEEGVCQRGKLIKR